MVRRSRKLLSLFDQIDAGNCLQPANCSLKSESELRVGYAHFQAQIPARKDKSRQFLIEANGSAKEGSERATVFRHSAGQMHLGGQPVTSTELAERTADRCEQDFDDDPASSSGGSVLQAAQHDGILELLELDERTTIQDLQMILQRADSVSKRIAATHARAPNALREHHLRPHRSRPPARQARFRAGGSPPAMITLPLRPCSSMTACSALIGPTCVSF